MHKHKILEDRGFNRKDVPENWGEQRQDSRLHDWKLMRKEYGFDERDVWNLHTAFAFWLLERLVYYKEHASVNLQYHKNRYHGKIITQGEALDMMIENLDTYLKDSWNETAWYTATELWSLFGQFFWY